MYVCMYVPLVDEEGRVRVVLDALLAVLAVRVEKVEARDRRALARIDVQHRRRDRAPRHVLHRRARAHLNKRDSVTHSTACNLLSFAFVTQQC